MLRPRKIRSTIKAPCLGTADPPKTSRNHHPLDHDLMRDVERNIDDEEFYPLQNWINRSSSRDSYGYHGPWPCSNVFWHGLLVFGPDQFKYHDTIIIFYKVDNAFLRPCVCFFSRHFCFFIRRSQKKQSGVLVPTYERGMVAIRGADYYKFRLDIWHHIKLSPSTSDLGDGNKHAMSISFSILTQAAYFYNRNSFGGWS